MKQTGIYDFIPKNSSCEICGNRIEKVSKFKPIIYCCDACRDYAKFKNALEKAVLKMNPTKEATRIIRGDMFRLANILSKKKEIA